MSLYSSAWWHFKTTVPYWPEGDFSMGSAVMKCENDSTNAYIMTFSWIGSSFSVMNPDTECHWKWVCSSLSDVSVRGCWNSVNFSYDYSSLQQYIIKEIAVVSCAVRDLKFRLFDVWSPVTVWIQWFYIYDNISSIDEIRWLFRPPCKIWSFSHSTLSMTRIS